MSLHFMAGAMKAIMMHYNIINIYQLRYQLAI
jgi:hypothetical protein